MKKNNTDSNIKRLTQHPVFKIFMTGLTTALAKEIIEKGPNLIPGIKNRFMRSVEFTGSVEMHMVEEFLKDQIIDKAYNYRITRQYIPDTTIKSDIEFESSALKLAQDFNILIWYNNWPIWFSCIESLDNYKYKYKVYTFDPFNKVIRSLISDITRREKKAEKLDMYSFDGRSWDRDSVNKRDIEFVFIDDNKKRIIMDSINRFESKEGWYIKYGIPHHLGILLYGPPGTGKTSLIRAIATETNRKMYTISASQLSCFQGAMYRIQDEVPPLVVIEDIDSSILTKSRDSMIQASPNSDPIGSNRMTTMADILNTIDGIQTNSNVIYIFTTNHIDKLDPALLRPGRVDLAIDIGYMDNKSIAKALKHYFPESKINFSKYQYKKDITGAQLQAKVLNEIPVKDILAEIRLYDKE